MIFPDEPVLDAIATGALLSGLGLLYVMALIRLIGLRSLSKMTNFDFVATVAFGSLLAGIGQASSWTAVWQAMAAMTGLLAVQYILARLRKTSDAAEDAMQNEPLVLFENGSFCSKAMSQTRVAKSDIYAKMREANVLSLGAVRAVVLETTGDVSVLHGDNLDEALLNGVRRKD